MDDSLIFQRDSVYITWFCGYVTRAKGSSHHVALNDWLVAQKWLTDDGFHLASLNRSLDAQIGFAEDGSRLASLNDW